MPRLLVVSHPAVLAVNQVPYAALRDYGWDPYVVVPARWRHSYSDKTFAPEVLEELTGRVVGRRVIIPGREQRFMFVSALWRTIAEVAPAAAFVEQEPTSASGFQLGLLLSRAGVPFGLQADENLDRPWPWIAREFRRQNLKRAAFTAARSPTAAALLKRIRADAKAPVIPHHVPAWPVRGDRAATTDFVVGFAGRLVPEKGLADLIDAVAGLDGVALRFVGNGLEREALQRQADAARVRLEIDTTVKHEGMAAAYASFDVLALPSRTTVKWAEQFGRALVEAMSCGVPVVGSDSGEIPWVIETTGGGLVFREGDSASLREALVRLRDDPALRAELASRGGVRAQELFGVDAVARGLDEALRAAIELGGVSTPPARFLAHA
jgi:glycosyltransferase involved in cell wall biosynthesis